MTDWQRQEESLFLSILLNPDSPEFRHVYADWCEENYASDREYLQSCQKIGCPTVMETLKNEDGFLLVNSSGLCYWYINELSFKYMGNCFFIRSIRCNVCNAQYCLRRFKHPPRWICYDCFRNIHNKGSYNNMPTFLVSNMIGRY